MKNLIYLSILAFAMAFTPAQAQEFSGLDKSPADIATYPASSREPQKKVKVIYSRPQLKGRSLADLAPAGKVWRTGANEATEVVLYQDATVAGKSIEAGTYSLFTIPGNGEWTVIFNKNVNQWGAYSYEQEADAIRVQAKASEAQEELEAFSIAFKEVDNGAHMVLGWGTTRVAVPMEFQ